MTRRLQGTVGLLAIFVAAAWKAAEGQSPVRSPVADARARVTGLVFDSIARRPLAGAVVQLVAVDNPSRIRSSRSNRDGIYTLDSITAGVYLLGLLHDRLDSLGIESPLRRIEVQSSGEINVPLAIPSITTLITQHCGSGAPGQARTLFLGVVRRTRPADSTVPARVRAQWPEVLVGPNGIERRSPVRFVNATAAGAFAFCDVPNDVPITTRAFAGPDSSGVVVLTTPASGLLLRDLHVGPATRVQLAATSTTAATSVLRGTARVRGVVRSAAGLPLRGARLEVWDTGISVTTSVSGQFAMQDLPSGTHTIESRAVGFQPSRVAVDLTGGAETMIDIALDIVVPTVDTMRIRARANGAVPLEEFERRRKSGFGHFLDETQVQERRAMYVADLFRSIPGMTIMPGLAGNDRVLMRSSGGGGACVPALYVNGGLVPNTNGVLGTFVSAGDVRAVEVYSRTASVPLQFESRTGCGSIVIWTGARRSPPPGR